MEGETCAQIMHRGVTTQKDDEGMSLGVTQVSILLPLHSQLMHNAAHHISWLAALTQLIMYVQPTGYYVHLDYKCSTLALT